MRMRPSVPPDPGALVGRGRQRKPTNPAPKKPQSPEISIRTLTLVGIAGLLVFAGSAFTVRRYLTRDAGALSKAAALRTDAWQGPSIAGVAEHFIKAETVEERLKWVRDPSRVEPLLREFYVTGAGARESIANFSPIATPLDGSRPLRNFGVELDGGGRRLLSLVPDQGGVRVDFESYIRLCSESWASLLDGSKQEAAMVRLIVQPGGYYNFQFADETKWLCFTAKNPDLDGNLSLYISRAAPDFHAMVETLKTNPRARLSIRSVEGSQAHRQFEITRVHGPGWVND